MEYVKTGTKTIIRFARDEVFIDSLTKLAKKLNWKAGHISGIGAVKNTELGFYDFTQQEYLKKTIPDICELVSLQGNMSYVDQEPFFHIHVSIADRSYQCFGGHLFAAEVGVTAELIFEELDLNIIRSKQDAAVPLNLLDFSHCGGVMVLG